MSQREKRGEKQGTLTDSLLTNAPPGQTVAQYSTRGRRKRTRRTRKGTKVATIDAAWYVFDSLTEQQAETLLLNHGSDGSYLLSQFDDSSNSYRMSFVAHKTTEGVQMYRHYDIICNSSGWYSIKGMQSGEYASVEEAVRQVTQAVKPEGVFLKPIFHECEESGNYTISPDAVDVPPRYTEAKRYPTAPQKRLPVVLRPTLRRLNIMTSNSIHRPHVEEAIPPEEPQTGCWYRVWHTDPDGSWYKPHKAGCLTAIFLIIGWLFFLLLFGWIIAIALVLVTILIVFAATVNFLCTGHCELGDDDDDS